MKLFVFISLLGLVLQLNLTDSKDINTDRVDLKHVGPTLFEMGTEAKLVCKFNPLAKALDGKDYKLRWQKDLYRLYDTFNHYQTLVDLDSKSTVPTYRQVYTPGYKEGSKQYNMSNGPLSSGQSSLTIYNVQVDHDRRHRCQIIDLHDKVIASSEVKLNVFKKPTVYLDEYSSDKVSNENVKKFVTCTVSHVYPQPSITSIRLESTHSGHGFHPRGVQLSTYNTEDKTYDINANFDMHTDSRHKEGYQCVVKMKLEKSEKMIFKSNKSSIPILVEHPTTFSRLSMSPTNVEEGQEVTISCQCDGYPINKLVIYNLKDWSRIASSNDKTSQFLQVKMNATRNMTGHYICEANHHYYVNDLFVKWHDDLIVEKNGEVFNGSNIIIQEGDDLTLSCEQYASEGSFKDEVVIYNATARDSQTFTCWNSHGPNIEIKIDVQLRCVPQLRFEKSETENELFNLTATCKAIQGNPQCEFEMSTAHKFNVEPTVVKNKESLTWTYEGLRFINGNPEFSCSLSNEINKIRKHVMVTEGVTYEVDIGLSVGVIAGIALAAVVVVAFIMGIVCYYHRENLSEILRTDRYGRFTDGRTVSPTLERDDSTDGL